MFTFLSYLGKSLIVNYPFACFAGSLIVYPILLFQDSEVILYGSMPYAKHVFNILTCNSRVIFDNSLKVG